jgi:beta-mannosidase
MNVFSPAFENHQKNSGGNQIILDYISRRYRFPKDYRSLAYLSHLNQAWCLKVGVEHFRRQQPHCLGALYWQLNDCWPVASWSSLEFGGKWKALHYAARRFFAPSMASVHVHGGEQRLIGNYRHHTTGRVDLWTIHDLPTPRRASLEWRLLTLDGERLDGGRKAVVLRPGESRLQVTLDYAAQAARLGHENMVLRVMLHEHGNGGILSDESILFAPPRAVPLVQRPPCASWKRVSPGVWSLTLRSDTLHLAVWVDPANNEARVSDNFFDLHAGEAVTVQVTSPTDPRTSTTIMSLVDSYSEPDPN